MADELLRQFYVQLGQLIGPSNELRIALLSGDDAIAKQQAERFLALSAQKERLVDEYAAYSRQIREWGFAIGAWAHGGSNDPKPLEPTAPAGVPDNRDASRALDELTHLRKMARQYLQGEFNAKQTAELVEMMLWELIRILNAIQQTIVDDSRPKAMD